MPDTIKDGGPAFPVHPNTNPAGEASGMSLRDWFAGQAIAGLAQDEACKYRPRPYADWAYGIADAMLAARGAR